MCTVVSLVASGGCIKVKFSFELMEVSCRIREKAHSECVTSFHDHKTTSRTSIKDTGECGTTFLGHKTPSSTSMKDYSECGTTFSGT